MTDDVEISFIYQTLLKVVPDEGGKVIVFFPYFTNKRKLSASIFNLKEFGWMISEGF